MIVWQTTSKNSTEMRTARAARLFFHIYPIRSFFLASSLPLPSLLKLPVVSMKRVFCYLLCEEQSFVKCGLTGELSTPAGLEFMAHFCAE